MFRVTNARSNQLVELEVKVLFSRIEGEHRKYDQLTLERSRVTFFPLSWTVVHPIDEKSPMAGMTATEFMEKDAEVMILLTGTDETFSTVVHGRSRTSPTNHVWQQIVNLYNRSSRPRDVSIDVRKLSETKR
jgi:inward rectifier potassium channel